jgi:hypothetical protein
MPEESSLIAPCGMNCGICLAHLRKERRCPGCRADDKNKPAGRMKCVIKNCETVKLSKSGFCYECETYPCKRLKQLDKRYKTKYAMSMIENLASIKAAGLSAFIEKEQQRWHCPKCGGVICVHRGYCLDCGKQPA